MTIVNDPVIGKEYAYTELVVGCVKGTKYVSNGLWENFCKRMRDNTDDISKRCYNSFRDIIEVRSFSNLHSTLPKELLNVTNPSRSLCDAKGDVTEDDSYPLTVGLGWKGLGSLSEFDGSVIADIFFRLISVYTQTNVYSSVSTGNITCTKENIDLYEFYEIEVTNDTTVEHK